MDVDGAAAGPFGEVSLNLKTMALIWLEGVSCKGAHCSLAYLNVLSPRSQVHPHIYHLCVVAITVG
jgi:hypothetical protein